MEPYAVFLFIERNEALDAEQLTAAVANGARHFVYVETHSDTAALCCSHIPMTLAEAQLIWDTTTEEMRDEQS